MKIFFPDTSSASLILPPYVDFRSEEDTRKYERRLRLIKMSEADRTIAERAAARGDIRAVEALANAQRFPVAGTYEEQMRHSQNQQGLISHGRQVGMQNIFWPF